MNFLDKNLQILVEEVNNTIVLTWLGRSEIINPNLTVEPFLEELLINLKALKMQVDFSKLSYMNSSTVPVLFRLIERCDKKNISIEVVYGEDIPWQAKTFKFMHKVLKRFKSLSIVSI